MGNLVLKRFLTATDILSHMYPGYVKLVEPQGRNAIIMPTSQVQVVLGAGSVAYGATSALRIGYPNQPDYVAGLSNFGMTATTSQALWLPPQGVFTLAALTDFVNQPLIVGWTNGHVGYAPIRTSALATAGTGYTALDELTTETGGSTVQVLTVAALTGAILTYAITVNNPEPVGVQALSGGSGADASLDIRTTGPQGNGQLYLEFNYQLVTAPFPIH